MEYKVITAVGIDVSKGKSMVAVRRPGGEVVMLPFQVNHDAAGLSSLVKALRGIEGDVRIVIVVYLEWQHHDLAPWPAHSNHAFIF